MNRTATAAAVALLVLLSVAAPALGTPATPVEESPRWHQTTTTPLDANETASTANGTSPGARLGGVVAAQGVAVGTEIESRSLRHQLNQSKSNASKAAVLARQVNQSQSRLAALRAERERLETAYRNGTVSESEYRIRATRLSAQISAIRRLNTQTSDVADRLPRETLRQNGVNVTALRSLRSMADEVEGPEIAAIAREIAGPQNGLGPSRADERRGARGENRQGGPGNGEGGPDGRPGGGPPDEDRRQATANESTDSSGTEDDPTPRGKANGGPTNSSADERGQGESGGNGDPGNGEQAGGNGKNGGNSGSGGNDGNGGNGGNGGDGDPGDGNAGRAEGQ
jgi:hypothetical protein